MFNALFSGFLFGLSLILAIGAQNAYVLRQGILGQRIFLVCLTCALSDALLILIGVLGMDSLQTALPSFAQIMRIGGALFLSVYGILRLISAWRGGHQLKQSQSNTTSIRRVLLTTLAITWLNPHVYIDTVLLLGTIAANFAPYQLIFGAGATVASFTFFFSLGYGAKLFAPWLSRPKVWRVIELLIGLFMLYLAIHLLVDN